MQAGSGGGGFVIDLGTLAVIAIVVLVLVALGAWLVFEPRRGLATERRAAGSSARFDGVFK
jgi:hypothetical protein